MTLPIQGITPPTTPSSTSSSSSHPRLTPPHLTGIIQTHLYSEPPHSPHSPSFFINREWEQLNLDRSGASVEASDRPATPTRGALSFNPWKEREPNPKEYYVGSPFKRDRGSPLQDMLTGRYTPTWNLTGRSTPTRNLQSPVDLSPGKKDTK